MWCWNGHIKNSTLDELCGCGGAAPGECPASENHWHFLKNAQPLSGYLETKFIFETCSHFCKNKYWNKTDLCFFDVCLLLLDWLPLAVFWQLPLVQIWVSWVKAELNQLVYYEVGTSACDFRSSKNRWASVSLLFCSLKNLIAQKCKLVKWSLG